MLIYLQELHKEKENEQKYFNTFFLQESRMIHTK